MTTMLIVLAVIALIPAIFIGLVGLAEGGVEGLAGFFAGLWLGISCSAVVGFVWIVLHFVGKFW